MTQKTAAPFLRRLPYLLVPLVMLGLFLAASMSDREDPAAPVQTFVAGIYEYYAADNGPPLINDTVLSTLFSDELMTLWQQGQTLSQQLNEPNSTGYDPFCLCQEYYQLRLASVTVKLVDATRAEAEVRITMTPQGDSDGPHTFHLGYRLSADAGGNWRVDDILAPTAQDPSLRARLAGDIVSAAVREPVAGETPETGEPSTAGGTSEADDTPETPNAPKPVPPAAFAPLPQAPADQPQ